MVPEKSSVQSSGVGKAAPVEDSSGNDSSGSADDDSDDSGDESGESGDENDEKSGETVDASVTKRSVIPKEKSPETQNTENIKDEKQKENSDKVVTFQPKQVDTTQTTAPSDESGDGSASGDESGESGDEEESGESGESGDEEDSGESGDEEDSGESAKGRIAKRSEIPSEKKGEYHSENLRTKQKYS